MRALVAVLAACLLTAGCFQSAPAEPVRVEEHDGFEDGLGAWQPRSEVPDDPNRPGKKVNWSIGVDDGQARNGSAALNFTLDGRQDDGTIWVVRSFQLTPGSGYAMGVSAWFYSESESFNTIAHVVLRVHPDAPTGEDSFPTPGPQAADNCATREPLNQAAGWMEYHASSLALSPEDGVVHVAIGISAVWETQMTYYADDVTVGFTPM